MRNIPGSGAFSRLNLRCYRLTGTAKMRRRCVVGHINNLLQVMKWRIRHYSNTTVGICPRDHLISQGLA